MAKKASRSKRAATSRRKKKASVAKRSAKKASASTKRKRVTVPVQSVVLFVKMLYDQGHADQFINSAKSSKAVMTIEANSVKFVRDYLATHQLRRMTAMSVVDPCPGDPFECSFDD